MKLLPFMPLLLFLFLYCAACHQPLASSIVSTSTNVNRSAHRNTQEPTLELSVPSGEFINEITVFAFYNRHASESNGITIRYTSAETGIAADVTDNSLLFPVEGIHITASTHLRVAVFDASGNELIEQEAQYTKQTIQRSLISDGIMLQCFTWDSVNQNREWYKEIQRHADDIKSFFTIAWFPPPSVSQDGAPQGYGPSELNNLSSKYGDDKDLSNVINALKPLTVIADIVVNHRNGSSDWADFSNPQWTIDYMSICGNDPFFSFSNPGYNWKGAKGINSEGELFESFRNLDHSNKAVQDGIVSWMNSVLYRVGFTGWRFDYVKGYPAQYAADYASRSSPVFIVGEYWPSIAFNETKSSDWSTAIALWQEKATPSQRQNMYVFDFVLRGIFNSISKAGSKYCLLADENALFRCKKEAAVTFVNNHDTAREKIPNPNNPSQMIDNLWNLNPSFMRQAYAFILVSPSIPCVFWDDYIGTTDATMPQHIKTLIEIRRDAGIECSSLETIMYASPYMYIAKIEGKNKVCILKIGTSGSNLRSITPNDFNDDLTIMTSVLPTYAGENFALWTYTKRGTEVCSLQNEYVNEPQKNITYTAPAEWQTVFAHLWKSDGTIYTSWPGIAMQKTDGNTWTLSVPASCDRVVFNNADNYQTDDIDISYGTISTIENVPLKKMPLI